MHHTEMDPVRAIQAIDVHGHYGRYQGARSPLVDRFMTGDPARVVARGRVARVRLTLVSPLSGLLPRGAGDPVTANREAMDAVAGTDGLLQWVILDPLHPETFGQAEELLPRPKCAGIKIHPEEHVYPIRENGREIFEFAARHRAIILTHSGEPKSLPADFVPLANAFPEVTLILGHLGCGHDGDPSHQVRAIQQSQHGNMFVDTSSAQNIMPGLIEWAVGEVGAERLLFGTDTPLYDAPMQRARVDSAGITDEEKRCILCRNAERIFGRRIPR